MVVSQCSVHLCSPISMRPNASHAHHAHRGEACSLSLGVDGHGASPSTPAASPSPPAPSSPHGCPLAGSQRGKRAHGKWGVGHAWGGANGDADEEGMGDRVEEEQVGGHDMRAVAWWSGASG